MKMKTARMIFTFIGIVVIMFSKVVADLANFYRCKLNAFQIVLNDTPEFYFVLPSEEDYFSKMSTATTPNNRQRTENTMSSSSCS